MSSPQWQDQQWPAELTPYLRTMRIIVFAMATGCIFFLVVTQVIGFGGPKQAAPPIITYTACLFAATVVFMRFVVPGIVVAAGRKNLVREMIARADDFEFPTDVGDLFKSPEFGNKLCGLLQTKTIISVALLEGAAFFSLIAYMIEGTPLSIIVAVALIIGIMLHFPTRARMIDWIERQLQNIQGERGVISR